MEKSTKTMVITDEVILNKIYHIRGHKVMLDEELAGLYEVSTKGLNEQDGVGSQQPKAKTCLFENHLIRYIHSVGKEETESPVNSQRQKPADLITNFHCRDSVPGGL